MGRPQLGMEASHGGGCGHGGLASTFAELGICKELVEACDLMGWKEPTRILQELLEHREVQSIHSLPACWWWSGSDTASVITWKNVLILW